MPSPSKTAVWLQAARPRTLGAAVAPVIMGLAMAGADGAFHLPSALACLSFALLLQVGANFCNDVADYLKGADTADRQGPLRVTQAGLVSTRTMIAATAAVFALALAVGLYLAARVGWVFGVVVVLAVASGILYTAGPRPLGYLGLGDLFVFVFFGPVAVAGTYFAQTLRWGDAAAAAGIAPGLLSVAIVTVNNLRDLDGDAAAGKRTLAVRFGPSFARMEYVLCLAGAFAMPPLLLAIERFHPFGLLALFAAPAAATPLRRVLRDRGAALNPALGETGRLLLLYGTLFAVGRFLV